MVRYRVRRRGTRLDRVWTGTRVHLQAWSTHVLDTDPYPDIGLQVVPRPRSMVHWEEGLSSCHCHQGGMGLDFREMTGGSPPAMGVYWFALRRCQSIDRDLFHGSEGRPVVPSLDEY